MLQRQESISKARKKIISDRILKSLVCLFVFYIILSFSFPLSSRHLGQSAAGDSDYFPGRSDAWQERKPEDLGIDSRLLQEAIDFAIANEWQGPKDLKISITQGFAEEPYGEILGPTKERGTSNGMILKNGYIVAEWGDTERVDMTFSVTKSYLSTVAGLALDRGLIQSVSDPVKNYVTDGKFDSEHNAKINWHHLLTQTSDWSGILWDKPDWSDRPPNEVKWEELRNRELKEPGTYFKYNDVRVNLLAYSLLQVWRESLPKVLRERILDPINASSTWRWNGYKNSWVVLDGVKIQSVSGGGHWGGGMFISTRDQARFGLLFLRRGKWNGKQLISEEWIEMLKVPTLANPGYGYMWWLNTDRKALPSAPETIFYAAGFGGNYIVVDNEHELVVVVRWVGSTQTLDGIMRRVLASIDR